MSKSKNPKKLEDELNKIISTLLNVIKEECGINIKIDNLNINQFIAPIKGDENIISPVYIKNVKPNTELLIETDSSIDKRSNHIYAKLYIDEDGNVNSEYVENDDLDITPEDPKDKKSLKKKIIDTLKKRADTIVNIICTAIQVLILI